MSRPSEAGPAAARRRADVDATPSERRPASLTAPFDKGDRLLDRVVARSAGRVAGKDEVERLVAATFDVLAAAQSDEPQVRDILDRSGLSRVVLYSHFESKDELLLVMVDESWRILHPYLQRRLATASDPADAVCRWVTGVLRLAEDPDARRRTRPFVMLWARLEAKFPEVYAAERRALCALLVPSIVAGVRSGAFTSTDPAADARVIHDAVFARQLRHLAVDTSPEESEELCAFVLRGLGVPSGVASARCAPV